MVFAGQKILKARYVASGSCVTISQVATTFLVKLWSAGERVHSVAPLQACHKPGAYDLGEVLQTGFQLGRSSVP